MVRPEVESGSRERQQRQNRRRRNAKPDDRTRPGGRRKRVEFEGGDARNERHEAREHPPSRVDREKSRGDADERDQESGSEFGGHHDAWITRRVIRC